jgi:2-desacetyl-2-hydroxyethyl bacteriochlorophyllide A dehydrogenase
MKVITLDSPLKIGIKNIPMPERKNDNEVLIKVRALGICGSDIGAYRGVNPTVSYPRIIGHEIGGEVVEIGENSKGIVAGDRVVLEPYMPCYQCHPCSIGRTNCCEKLKVLGTQTDGGMAEYVSHPLNLVHVVPREIEWQEVAMIEPLTIALHANHRARVKEGEHVLIIGAGAIGLLSAQVAMVYGAIPVVVDVEVTRLQLAKEIGIPHTLHPVQGNVIQGLSAITKGRMAEVVIEASGANGAVHGMFDYASAAGRIALVGWVNGETPLPTAVITKKELDIVGSRSSVNEFPEAIALLQNKQVQVDKIISRVVSFDEIPDAIMNMAGFPDQFVKVVAVL